MDFFSPDRARQRLLFRFVVFPALGLVGMVLVIPILLISGWVSKPGCLDTCGSEGRCTAFNFGSALNSRWDCVATDDIHCLESDLCRAEGLCSAVPRPYGERDEILSCEAVQDADCVASFVCAEEGRCSAIDGSCKVGERRLPCSELPSRLYTARGDLLVSICVVPEDGTCTVAAPRCDGRSVCPREPPPCEPAMIRIQHEWGYSWFAGDGWRVMEGSTSMNDGDERVILLQSDQGDRWTVRLRGDERGLDLQSVTPSSAR
ncbi:MAG: hypothetical protein ABIO70_27475 [Pseudomonadota bacterium]